MLYFYYVNKEYANFLRQDDEKVPNLNYDSHDKFFCGVVFEINGFKYDAPISHETVKQQTSLIIYDKGRAISSIKFAFMIPVLLIILLVMVGQFILFLKLMLLILISVKIMLLMVEEFM